MNKVLVLIVLTLLATTSVSDRVSPCPVQSNIGSLISARITIAQQQSLVTLIQGTDSQCYNHTLPYDFASVPEVAVAVHDFQSRASNDLFFSIKPIQSDSVTLIPFLIRTHWRYTFWSKIAFSFIAEDRKDFESGYYQVDSGSLGSCESGKNIQVILPFRRIQSNGFIKHNIFLHGFEISSQKYNADTMSPFEVQLAQSSTNSSGIIVLITVTSVTQVHAIHISYIAWVSTQLNIITGNYTYDPTADGVTILAHSPVDNVGRNYARIHGLTGFIINNNLQNLTFTTTWTGTRFQFSLGLSQNLVQYFSFQYLFFIGSECSSCPGYQFANNGVCVESCPVGSYPTTEKTCINCGDGFYWDGSGCIKLCPVGQTLNVDNNQCECPAGTNWTGTICLNCTLGRVFNSTTKLCECPAGTRWNGFTCARIDPCTSGREWNVFSFRCECPTGSTWNGTFCVRRKVCSGGSYLDNSTNECVCPDGTFLTNGFCQSTGCIGGQQWDGKTCKCDEGFNWNGTVCLLCINGQVWNENAKACLCEANNEWNGNFCEKKITCSGGRVWNKEYQVCMCPDGQAWNGNTCIVKEPCCCGKFWNDTSLQCDCPDGFNWDGRTCVFCTNGKIWDITTRTCICQTGTQWNGQFCAVIQRCQGGSIWNQNTWACECPASTVWNNVYCVANTCRGGQIWDNLNKYCVCPGVKVFYNGTCQNPEATCINGQIWDRNLLVCVCPPRQWYNGTYCVLIPTCVNNQIYNALTNKCDCPPNLVFLSSKQICGDPTCPPNKRWDGQSCVDLTCPPNTFYNGSVCVCPNANERCLPWQLFDGEKCVYFQSTCPKGTRWNGTACVSNTPDCLDGFYKDGNQCRAIPQRCLPSTIWSNNRCVPTGGSCPYGTVGRSDNCQPYTACQGGQVWDQSLIQCVCPKGTGWSGKECVVCGGGQVWTIADGCTCPEGLFMNGAKCEKPAANMCKFIPNAYFDNTKNLCACNPGFTVVGYQCVCKGVPFENFCDRCAHRPNSEYYFGICRCNTGYTLYGTECLPNVNNGGNVPSDCAVATFFDSQQRKCLPCPDGCLRCSDCYTCIQCNVDFYFDAQSSLCKEKCGDGKRYVDECDDGGIANGDGCSADCKVEQGYICRGGSPNSADSCSTYTPNEVTFQMTGQIRYTTKVVLNIKIDYLPTQLLQSKDCNDRCSNVIMAEVSNGDRPTSVRSYYVAGSRFSFSVELEFSRPYMSKFSAQIKVNPALSRYFKSVSIAKGISVDVNPSQLTKAVKSKDALN